jgi:hypothetical protein
MNRSCYRLVGIAEEIYGGSAVQTKSSNINRLVTAILIGTGAGLLMGSRTVKTYVWRTQ